MCFFGQLERWDGLENGGRRWRGGESSCSSSPFSPRWRGGFVVFGGWWAMLMWLFGGRSEEIYGCTVEEMTGSRELPRDGRFSSFFSSMLINIHQIWSLFMKTTFVVSFPPRDFISLVSRTDGGLFARSSMFLFPYFLRFCSSSSSLLNLAIRVLQIPCWREVGWAIPAGKRQASDGGILHRDLERCFAKMGSNFWRRGTDIWSWNLGWEKIMNGRRRGLGKEERSVTTPSWELPIRPIQPASNQPWVSFGTSWLI